MVLGFIAAASTFTSFLLVGYWLVQRPRSVAESRLRALASGDRAGYQAALAQEDRPSRLGRGLLILALGAIGGGLLGVLGTRYLAKTEGRLIAAGRPLTPSAFYAAVLVMATMPPFLLFTFLVITSHSVSTPLLLALMVLGMAGAYAPFGWVRSRIGKRQKAIRKELTDVLDLLTLCVESGLGLDAAFRRVAEEMVGPLATEILQMLDEVELGKPRRDALADLADRAVIPEVGVVVKSMIQSQQMGTSLGATLRSQTQRLRLKRRQRAEQMARQATVKMAFPLVLFLMPSTFIVILGPIAVELFSHLS
jgi:tight adherence protein C